LNFQRSSDILASVEVFLNVPNALKLQTEFRMRSPWKMKIHEFVTLYLSQLSLSPEKNSNSRWLL